jgi:hypothetical protein
MAQSTCIKCGNTRFELVEPHSIAKANYRYMFVQCEGCGGVVGVTEVINSIPLLHQIMQKLGIPF